MRSLVLNGVERKLSFALNYAGDLPPCPSYSYREARDPHMCFGKRQPIGYRGVERRGHISQNVDLTAHVILCNGQFVKCRLTDLSSTGARLVAPVFGLPDTFQLRGPYGDCHVRLIHRRVGSAGVEFI